MKIKSICRFALLRPIRNIKKTLIRVIIQSFIMALYLIIYMLFSITQKPEGILNDTSKDQTNQINLRLIHLEVDLEKIELDEIKTVIRGVVKHNQWIQEIVIVKNTEDIAEVDVFIHHFKNFIRVTSLIENQNGIRLILQENVLSQIEMLRIITSVSSVLLSGLIFITILLLIGYQLQIIQEENQGFAQMKSVGYAGRYIAFILLIEALSVNTFSFLVSVCCVNLLHQFGFGLMERFKLIKYLDKLSFNSLVVNYIVIGGITFFSIAIIYKRIQRIEIVRLLKS